MKPEARKKNQSHLGLTGNNLTGSGFHPRSPDTQLGVTPCTTTVKVLRANSRSQFPQTTPIQVNISMQNRALLGPCIWTFELVWWNSGIYAPTNVSRSTQSHKGGQQLAKTGDITGCISHSATKPWEKHTQLADIQGFVSKFKGALGSWVKQIVLGGSFQSQNWADECPGSNTRAIWYVPIRLPDFTFYLIQIGLIPQRDTGKQGKKKIEILRTIMRFWWLFSAYYYTHESLIKIKRNYCDSKMPFSRQIS